MATFTTLVCATCSTPFSVYTSYLNLRPTKYCSRQCFYTRERLPSAQAVCVYCGRTFAVAHWNIKHRRMRVCSAACSNKARGQTHWDDFWSRANRCIHGDDCLYCCWEWTGPRQGRGYGVLQRHKKTIMAHREAWARVNNRPFPPHLDASHLCHNPPCCNPWHITPATPKENTATSMRDGRRPFGSHHGVSKLIEADIVEIFRLHASKWTNRDIAKHYDVSTDTIFKILHRRAWMHVHIDPTFLLRSGRGKSVRPDSPTVQEVWRLRQEGLTVPAIMQRLALGRHAVYSYIKLAQEEWHRAAPIAVTQMSSASKRTSVRIDRFAIYERDHGLCHICHKQVSRLSFNTDHLVPRSAGGSDAPANLALAHPRCNKRRQTGKRILAQLRLF